jgi:exosome complex RNA-binding protein Rrp42 (RNase PH superfamily)
MRLKPFTISGAGPGVHTTAGDPPPPPLPVDVELEPVLVDEVVPSPPDPQETSAREARSVEKSLRDRMMITGS